MDMFSLTMLAMVAILGIIALFMAAVGALYSPASKTPHFFLLSVTSLLLAVLFAGVVCLVNTKAENQGLDRNTVDHVIR